jgi:prevent-host-death family protein
VGIRELRQQASAVLKRVAAGESVVVTDHGHPVARIVPLRTSALEQLVSDGRASAAEGDLVERIHELRLPAAPVGAQLPSTALEMLRAAEA